MLGNKFLLIFVLIMLACGVGYNVYYFKVGKQKRIMKAMGRSPVQTPKTKAEDKPQLKPEENPAFSAPVVTANQPVESPAGAANVNTISGSDKISLPISERLLKLAQNGPASASDLASSTLTSFANLPRSSRNPFMSLEEERTNRGLKSGRTQPSQNSTTVKPQPLLQETPDIPAEDSTKVSKSQPEIVHPTLVQSERAQPVQPAVATRPVEMPLADLKVSAIIINGDRKTAIIEGQRVGEGSFIGSERVVEIKSDRVVLQRGKSRRDLMLSRAGSSVPLVVKKANGGL